MQSLDAPYDRLEPLPRGTWLQTLTAAVGGREARLDHVALWLQALDAGRLPEATADLGDAEASQPLRQVVGELGLPSLAKGMPALAEQILRTALWHWDRIVALQPRQTREQAIQTVTQEFREAWQIETAGLDAELVLLRELVGGEHLRWDQLRGQLRSREWLAARRAADRLAEMPELMALLQRLGRREYSVRREALPTPDEPLPDQRVPLRPVETLLAGAPGEITGIRLDSRLEHMLPSEAMGLRHPILRRLWRARQAEGRLLAHDTTAVVIDWRPDPDGRPQDGARTPRQQALERGPIVLCLDTSGSMGGAPENVAKAVAIAALRMAQQTRRGCRLIAFGGAGEIVEHDLAREGLPALLRLMGQSFDGGTDVQTPIERAVDLVHESAWTGADLLIVSDGEFGCMRSTLDRLEAARRDLGLFVQGMLIGDRETLGLLDVCDAIHWVRDWRRHADEGAPHVDRKGASPVHSKSLTQLYFPNALSPFASRHRGASDNAPTGGLWTPPTPP